MSAVIDCKRSGYLEELPSITTLIVRFIRTLKSKGLQKISTNDIFKAEEL